MPIQPPLVPPLCADTTEYASPIDGFNAVADILRKFPKSTTLYSNLRRQVRCCTALSPTIPNTDIAITTPMTFQYQTHRIMYDMVYVEVRILSSAFLPHFVIAGPAQ